MSRKEMPIIICEGKPELRWQKMELLFPSTTYTYYTVQRKGETYGIEDIRQLKKILSLQQHREQCVLYYFLEPGTFTDQAQQAMLLLLEEVPHGVQIVFLANTPTRFLPTILSRCVVTHVQAREETAVLEIPTSDIAESFLFTSHFTDKDEVLLLLKQVIRSFRPFVQRKNVRDAIGFLQGLYKDLQSTTVSPRLIAELTGWVYQRVLASNAK